MSFPFHRFLVIGMLAVVVCMQGCASRPPVASATPPQVKEPPQVREKAPVVAAKQSVLTNESTPAPVELPPRLPPLTPQPATPSQPAPAPVPAAVAKPATPDRSAPGLAPVEQPPIKVKPQAVPKPVPKPQPARKPVAPTAPSPVVASVPPPAKPITPAEPIAQAQPPLPTEPPAPAEPEVVVTLEALPLNIADEWTLSASGDVCTLSTPPVRFDDGQGMSRLQLVFTSQSWLVKTRSDIDMSYSDTGLTVDEGRHFPLDQLVRDTDLMFTKDYAAMTEAFMAARRLDIALGFWPSWPVTETKTITLSLQHFARAHRAWKSCQSLINAR